MLGKRSPQIGMFQADHMYIDYVGRQTFYGFLSEHRGEIFRDDDFASLYCSNNGRNSVPPSTLASALLLQTYDRVSDEEAVARADFDLRWKVALGIGIDDHPFAKSTLQLFRSQLILHEKMQVVFRKSLEFARESGYLKKHKVKVALDTSHILGRGAVKDTYNLLSDGIVRLLTVVAKLRKVSKYVWAKANGLSRYVGSSVKGESAVDWDDPAARQAFLAGIVADADRLMGLAREVGSSYAEGSSERQRIREAASLLGQLLLQDVDRQDGEVKLYQGVAKDRVVSVHDSEMRHGRKSKRTAFDGHKAAVAADCESGLILAAGVLPGNAYDSDGALGLVQESESGAGIEVEEVIGDCAYGDVSTRQAFAETGRILIAPVADRSNGAYFPKKSFAIDVERGVCHCPAGQECLQAVSRGRYKDRTGRVHRRQVFEFDAAACAACMLRPKCVKAEPGHGRTVSLHPEEALRQQARSFQNSPEYAPYRRMRQTIEHRVARLMQLGVRRARYFGRTKTLFQLLMAATVANLTLVAGKTGMMTGDPNPRIPCLRSGMGWQVCIS